MVRQEVGLHVRVREATAVCRGQLPRTVEMDQQLAASEGEAELDFAGDVVVTAGRLPVTVGTLDTASAGGMLWGREGRGGRGKERN